MQANSKAFVVVGGATFLAGRFVFSQGNRKALLYGLIAGAMVALLQIKTKSTAKATGISKTNSPALPETDNSSANIAPEQLVPLLFATGAPLDNSVYNSLEDI